MLKPKLENKAGTSAADALHAAEQRLADLDAELAELLTQATRNDHDFTVAEPEEVAGLRTERDLLAAQRAKLERDRAALEGRLPDLRKAKANEEWTPERTKQEYLRRQLDEAAAEVVAKAHALRESWERLEEIAKESDDLNRRIPARALRYGREPLPPVVPMFATNLPGVFAEAVATVAERVQSIDVDRARDPILTNPARGNMPVVSNVRPDRLAHRSINGETITPPAQPEPAAERPATRSRWSSLFGNAAA